MRRLAAPAALTLRVDVLLVFIVYLVKQAIGAQNGLIDLDVTKNFTAAIGFHHLSDGCDGQVSHFQSEG